MEQIILEYNNFKYPALFWKGKDNQKIAFVYFHGLDGKAKIVQPLQRALENFDLYSIEQRGHQNSLLKSSISVKKHDQDVENIVNCLKLKYEKIYLVGESMGAVYTARYGYKHNNVNGIFCWSIPFEPKDIIQEKFSKRFYIILRTIWTFFTSNNYFYTSKIDYPRLTNSKFLLKLNELDVNTKRQTSEAVALWKANFKVKRMFLRKKPQVPIYYWHGEDDFMTSSKTINKLKKKSKVIFEIIPNAKHILMFEKGFEIVTEKILKITKS